MSLRLFYRRCLARLECATSGYLVQIGWIETRAQWRALDTQGNAIPWFTYPAIRLLAERVRADWRVLEFGAGMGTVWWSSRVREIVAIEHDAFWANSIVEQCAARVLTTRDIDAQTYIAPARDTGVYDIVIVDGQHRNECLALATTLIHASSVIILDDAQRAEYQAATDSLHQEGFRSIALHGPQPVSKHPGCTRIFYRDGNVLGL